MTGLLLPMYRMALCCFADPIVKDQGRGATPGGMAASSTPVSSSSMMAGEFLYSGKVTYIYIKRLLQMCSLKSDYFERDFESCISRRHHLNVLLTANG